MNQYTATVKEEDQEIEETEDELKVAQYENRNKIRRLNGAKTLTIHADRTKKGRIIDNDNIDSMQEDQKVHQENAQDADSYNQPLLQGNGRLHRQHGSMIRMTPTEPSLFAQISRNPVVDRDTPQIGTKVVQNRRGKQRDRIMSATSRRGHLFRDNSPEQPDFHDQDYHDEEDTKILMTQLDQMNNEVEQPAMSCSSDESETEIMKYKEEEKIIKE